MFEHETTVPRYYFSTRDLLIMAAMAGLGGVTSTAISLWGAAMQALVGFAGTTQWAAGLHVIWLLLAVGLTRKGGAATVAGLLKGGVELLSGNVHGVIILLVNLAAGLLIDLVLAVFPRKDGRAALVAAGAVSAASNVFVFQLFAVAPEDILAIVWAFALLAAVSGAILGGLLAASLLGVLRRIGLARREQHMTMGRWRYPVFLTLAALLALGGGLYLGRVLAGPPTVPVTGAVDAPFEYGVDDESLPRITVEAELHGMRRRGKGVPLRDLVARAEPHPAAAAALVSATDGYAFFITLREIESNDNLILAVRGGDTPAYDIIGADNSKAWVRNVSEIRLVAQALVEARGRFENAVPYDPADWQYEMDNGELDLGDGRQKYQGLALRQLISAWEPEAGVEAIRMEDASGGELTLPLEQVLSDDRLRIWTVSGDEGMRFALAREGEPALVAALVAIIAE